MRYYRDAGDGGVRLVASDGVTGDDLTATESEPSCNLNSVSAATLTGQAKDDVGDRLADAVPTLDLADVGKYLVSQMDPDEVWPAGLSDANSREAVEGMASWR